MAEDIRSIDIDELDSAVLHTESWPGDITVRTETRDGGLYETSWEEFKFRLQKTLAGYMSLED